MGQPLRHVAEERAGGGIDLLGEQAEVADVRGEVASTACGPGSACPFRTSASIEPERAGHERPLDVARPVEPVEQRALGGELGPDGPDRLTEPPVLAANETGARQQQQRCVELVGTGVRRRSCAWRPTSNARRSTPGWPAARPASDPRHGRRPGPAPTGGSAGPGPPSSRPWRTCCAVAGRVPISRSPVRSRCRTRGCPARRAGRRWPGPGAHRPGPPPATRIRAGRRSIPTAAGRWPGCRRAPGWSRGSRAAGAPSRNRARARAARRRDG